MRSNSFVLAAILAAAPGTLAECDSQLPRSERSSFPHDPISRNSFGHIHQQSGGMNSDGYFRNPQSTESLWGVPLPDGPHSFPMEWEGGENAIQYEVHDGQVIRQTYDFEGRN